MTNPAKGIFEKYAHTGFYVGTGTEPTIKITVRDAKGEKTSDDPVAYETADVVFTYDKSAEEWTGGNLNEGVPAYYPTVDESAKLTNIALGEHKKGSTTEFTAAGDWAITVTGLSSSYTIPEPLSTTEHIKDYLKRVCADVYLTWCNAKAAGRTVYMDSNIALTDGEASVGSGKAKTIPNLYKAIHDMDTRIDAIDKDFAISTADAGLYVKPLVNAASKKQYANFLRDSGESDTPGIEISVGDGFDGINGNTMSNARDAHILQDYNMHFRANEITFTVSNPNQTVAEAYQIITAADVTPGTTDYKLNTQGDTPQSHAADIITSKANGDAILTVDAINYGAEYTALTTVSSGITSDYINTLVNRLKDVDTALTADASLTTFINTVRAYPDDDVPKKFPDAPGDDATENDQGAYNLLIAAHDDYVTDTLTVYQRVDLGIGRNGNLVNPYMNDVTNDLVLTYYWVPMEDNNTADHITNNKLLAGAHGKVLLNLSSDDGIAGYKTKLNTFMGDNAPTIMSGTASEKLKNAYAAAGTILGILNKNGTLVYLSHAVTTSEITVGTKKTDLQVSSEMTYNLGAIIEAIQELNRRTMFMDTDMSFNGAMSYGDYQKDVTDDTIHYGAVLDGLPAATDSTLTQHYGTV